MTRTGKATAVVTLGIALIFAGRQLPAQSGGENALARRVEGTWLVQATLRDCNTGVEIPNSTFPAAVEGPEEHAMPPPWRASHGARTQTRAAWDACLGWR